MPMTGSSLLLGPRPLTVDANKAIEQTRTGGHLMFSTKWFWALGITLGAAIVALAALPLALLEAGRVQAHQLDSLSPNASIFARGLIAPRGLKFEPDGTWYSMVHIGTTLYAVEANHGELDKITLDGHISRVADISFFMGHIVPTSVAIGPDGNFYIGNLSTMPYLDGKALILKVTPQGQVSIAATGLTTVLGVAFDRP